MIGGLIGIGTSLIGGLLGSNSASNAGKTLANAGTTAASNLNSTAATANVGIGSAGAGAQNGVAAATAGAQQQMATQMGNISPYQQAGQQGVQSLASALGPNGQFTQALNNNFSFNPSDLQNTPGYQFQLKQGLQAAQNQMTASGLGNSGAAIKGANNYATGLAGTYYQNAYNNALNSYQTNRQNTLYQMSALQNLAGIGQNANQQAMAGAEYIGNTGVSGQQAIGNFGMQTATQQGNWSMGAQQAAMQAYMEGQGGKAAGQMGSANAWQNAMGGIGNNLMSLSALGGMGGGGMFGSGGGGGVPWAPGSTSYDTSSGQFGYGGSQAMGTTTPMASLIPPTTTDPNNNYI